MEAASVPNRPHQSVSEYRLELAESAITNLDETKADKSEVKQVLDAVKDLKTAIRQWSLAFLSVATVFGAALISLLHH